MTKPAWILVVLLVGGFLVVDFFVPQVLFHEPWDVWPGAVLMGICVGQINLIGVWAAMTPGRVMLRLPWSIFLATLIWYALVLGNRVRWNEFSGFSYLSFTANDAVQMGLVLLVGVVVIQIPLWAASRWFRWRLVPPKYNSKEQLNERQFNLKHVLISMAVVSVIFGLGRIVLPPGDIRMPSLDRELNVLLPAIAIVNLLVAAPCIWFAFARRNHLLGWAGGWFAYVIIVTLIEVAILGAILGGPPDEVWLAFIIFNVVQCVTVAGTLGCLRSVGFRLVRLTSQA